MPEIPYAVDRTSHLLETSKCINLTPNQTENNINLGRVLQLAFCVKLYHDFGCRGEFIHYNAKSDEILVKISRSFSKCLPQSGRTPPSRIKRLTSSVTFQSYDYTHISRQVNDSRPWISDLTGSSPLRGEFAPWLNSNLSDSKSSESYFSGLYSRNSNSSNSSNLIDYSTESDSTSSSISKVNITFSRDVLQSQPTVPSGSVDSPACESGYLSQGSSVLVEAAYSSHHYDIYNRGSSYDETSAVFMDKESSLSHDYPRSKSNLQQVRMIDSDPMYCDESSRFLAQQSDSELAGEYRADVGLYLWPLIQIHQYRFFVVFIKVTAPEYRPKLRTRLPHPGVDWRTIDWSFIFKANTTTKNDNEYILKRTRKHLKHKFPFPLHENLIDAARLLHHAVLDVLRYTEAFFEQTVHLKKNLRTLPAYKEFKHFQKIEQYLDLLLRK